MIIIQLSPYIGALIRERRIELNWSQTELSNHCGLGGAGVISNLERGLQPSPTVARKLERTLGFDPGTLVRGDTATGEGD